MKNTILIVLVLFGTVNILCQDQNKNISPKVIQFFNLADSISKQFDREKGFLTKFPTNKINYIAKKYYDARNNPKDYRIYLDKKYKEWGENYKNGNTKTYKPGFKILLIKNLISGLKGQYYTDLIGIPYFLKVKILKIKHGKYVSYSPQGLTVPKVILIAKVEDVVKGKNKFKSNDTIKINIVSHRMSGEMELREGCKYFVPLRLFNYREGKWEGLALSVIEGWKHSIFPIINNKILDNNNYFHFGNIISWNEFKKKFSQNFILK